MAILRGAGGTMGNPQKRPRKSIRRRPIPTHVGEPRAAGALVP